MVGGGIVATSRSRRKAPPRARAARASEGGAAGLLCSPPSTRATSRPTPAHAETDRALVMHRPSGWRDAVERGHWSQKTQRAQDTEIIRNVVSHETSNNPEGKPTRLDWIRQNPKRLSSASAPRTVFGLLFAHRPTDVGRFWNWPILDASGRVGREPRDVGELQVERAREWPTQAHYNVEGP